MSSTAFQVSTIVLRNSVLDSISPSPLPDMISFSRNFVPAAQLNAPATEAQKYAGLLYTPRLSSQCHDTTSSIARNLTLQDIPMPIGLVAFAPASNCREYYVMQAVQDGAKAIVLYPPTNTSIPTIPPSSSIYGASIAVYFAAWQDASMVATAMNQYNTALSDVPFGSNLSTSYPADAFVRLVMTVERTTTRSLPGLWIFLLIVLGLLCLIVAVTSMAMHAHQYFARRDLRRRIATGEVDLEGLGIKRLTVPKKHLDALPQRQWLNSTNAEKQDLPGVSVSGSPTFDQTSCSICLEDYVHNSTTVRELPCHHIYHPACIDPFLLKSSSLCPLCKQSVLPKGYIPPDTLLTSATVMRERRRRRQQFRARATQGHEEADIEMQISSGTSQTNRANLTDLAAPDNDEEDRAIQSRGRMQRFWRKLFPSRNI